jgi:WD40 repeat protein
MLLLRGHGETVRSLAFSPDGRLLACASDACAIVLWDTRSGRVEGELHGHTNRVQGVAFAPDGTRLYSAGDDRTVRIWEVASGRLTHSSAAGPDPLVALAVHPSGALLALGGDRPRYLVQRNYRSFGQLYTTAPTLRVLHPSGQQIEVSLSDEFRTVAIWSLAFSPDGEFLAVGFANGLVLLLDTDSLPPLGLRVPGRRGAREAPRRLPHSVGVRALAWSGDARTLVTAPATPALVWDVPTLTVRFRFGEIKHAIESLAFAPDNRTLVTGCLDSTVRLWDTRTGLECGRFDWLLGRIHAVAVAPDGMTAAAGGENGDVIIWDLDL